MTDMHLNRSTDLNPGDHIASQSTFVPYSTQDEGL
ncbi:hypothetical protein SPHINGOR109_50427 [Sphingorhabdus sp. 109]|nr:hypothetical protein SPHINGOR109_50427 [Sphingorhabdus sp. 109]